MIGDTNDMFPGTREFDKTHPSRFWASQKFLKVPQTFLTLAAPTLLNK